MHTHHHRLRSITMLSIASLFGWNGFVAGQSAPKTVPPNTTTPSAIKPADQPIKRLASPDEDAIRATDVLMMKAYASHDPKQIAVLFTADAEYVDEAGNVDQGRVAIEESLREFFKENPNSAMTISTDSIRTLSPGIVVQDGATTITFSDNMKSIDTLFTAIYVKVESKWLVASLRDQVVKVPKKHSVELQQLSWLLGDWVDEGEDAAVHFSCEAVDQGNYLMRQFKIMIAGQDAMKGTQRIGWDPILNRFRAWTFDSEGAFSEGMWHHDGDQWLLKSNGVTSDGQTASSTTVYTFVNSHTMTWQSIDHEIDGEQLPDSRVVTIVRNAPAPVLAAAVDE